MNPNPLDSGTEAALTSLAAIAALVGVSALLTLSLLHRRGKRDQDVGMTTFEGFTCLIVFVLAALDAYLCVAYLREGKELSDAEFNAVAVFLVLATTIFVFFNAGARFSNLAGGFGVHLQTAVVTLFVAVAAAFAVPFLLTDPAEIVPAGALILLVGSCLAGSFFALERRAMAGTRKALREQFVSLKADGYRARTGALMLSLPEPYSEPEEVKLSCWSRKGKIYLDHSGCRRLREAARRRWAALETEEAMQAQGDRVLVKVDLTSRPLSWPLRHRLVLSIHKEEEPAPEEHCLHPDERGLFDITGLRLVRT